MCGLGEWRIISIHALREEGDTFPRAISPLESRFLSTPSARRATLRDLIIAQRKMISIHALREEGDLMRELAIRIKDISIHALREEGDQRWQK